MQYHLFLAKARLHAGNSSLSISIFWEVGRDDNVDAPEKFVCLLYGIEGNGAKGIDNARHSLL